MKITKYWMILAVISLAFGACQKDEAGKKELPGAWEGYWGFDAETPTIFEKWEIKKNGNLTAYNASGSVIATGTWEVDGLDFQAEYSPAGANYSYSFSGLYHDLLGEIIGTWGETPSKTDGGTFEMYKK